MARFADVAVRTKKKAIAFAYIKQMSEANIL
jgi:hypothetical protein